MALVAQALNIAFWTAILSVAGVIIRYTLSNLVYSIGIMLFQVMDILQSAFRKLAGLESAYIDEGSLYGLPVGGKTTSTNGDLLSAILRNNIIKDALISVTIFSVALLIVATIVQMIRTEYTTEGANNSKEKYFGTALKSLIMFILIPTVTFFGLRVSNYLLQAVDYATSQNGSSTISGGVFSAAASQACWLYLDQHPTPTSIGDFIGSGMGIGYAVSPSKFGATIEGDSDGVGTYKVANFNISVTASSRADAGRKLTNKVNELMLSLKNPGNILQGGVETSKYGGDGTRVGSVFSYKDVATVNYFYSTVEMNYLILFLGCYICIDMLFKASLGLVKRLYMGASLFIIMPATVGLQPLDDGNAYKKWRGKFISNALSAYGIIVSMNVYFTLIGVMQGIQLWEDNPLTWIPNQIIHFLFIIAGTTFIKDFAGTISDFIGGGNALKDGDDVAKSIGDQAGKVAKLGAGAAQFGMGVGNLVRAGIHRAGGGIDNLRANSRLKNGGTEGMADARNRRDALERAGYSRDNKGNWVQKDKAGNVTKTLDEKAFNDIFKNDPEMRRGNYSYDTFKGNDEMTAKHDELKARATKRREAASSSFMASKLNFHRADQTVLGGATSTIGNLSGNFKKFMPGGDGFKDEDEKFAAKTLPKDEKERREWLASHGYKNEGDYLKQLRNGSVGAPIGTGLSKGIGAVENALSPTNKIGSKGREKLTTAKAERESQIAIMNRAIQNEAAQLNNIETLNKTLASDHDKITMNDNTKNIAINNAGELKNNMNELINGINNKVNTSELQDLLNKVNNSGGLKVKGGVALSNAVNDYIDGRSSGIDKDVLNSALNGVNEDYNSRISNIEKEYGTDEERSEYRDRKQAIEASEKTIHDMERALKDGVEAGLSGEQLKKTFEDAVGKSFAEINKAFNDVHFNLDPDKKLKFDDEPIKKAVNDIKAELEKNKPKDDSETDKLLKELIKETKKNGK